jgi:hypothetical protein
MNETQARETLKRLARKLDYKEEPFIWDPSRDEAFLEGSYTAEDLEAVAWWMRNSDKAFVPFSEKP